MKRFNQNRTQSNRVGDTNTQASTFSNLTYKSHTMAAIIIFAVIVLHFASQFVFFQNDVNQIATIQPEKIVAADEAATDNRIISVEIEPEHDAENLKVAAMSKDVPPIIKSETKIAPSRTVTKKAEPRESKTERLRRAEKLLTGF